MSAGTVITGGVESPGRVTLTLNDADAELLCASVAVQLTVVSPMGNVDPEAGAQFTATDPSTRSLAVGFEYVTSAPDADVASTEMSAGTPAMDGGVVSWTVILKDLLAELPCESVALHSTVVCPIANVEPEAGAQLKLVALSPVSSAGAVSLTIARDAAVASAVMSAGTVITGGVVSASGVTVTLNDADPELLCASDAPQLTVVSPIGNVDPDASKQLTATGPSTSSLAVGLEYDTTAPADDVACTVISAGTPTIDGAVVSCTVTLNDLLAEFPCESVALQFTVVCPNANIEPDAGTHPKLATASSGSVAEAT